MDVRSISTKREIRRKKYEKLAKETTLCAYVCYIKPVVKQEWVCGFFLYSASFTGSQTEEIVIFHRILDKKKINQRKNSFARAAQSFLVKCFNFFLWLKLIRSLSSSGFMLSENKVSLISNWLTFIYQSRSTSIWICFFSWNHFFYAVANEVHHVLSGSYNFIEQSGNQTMFCDSSNKKISCIKFELDWVLCLRSDVLCSLRWIFCDIW